ncbi:MAG: hypothetical protein JRJ70_10100 [Deltaproteobacteria bacterium]|nr:hypothetical protein [Deltaproteobacteria bacterium]
MGLDIGAGWINNIADSNGLGGWIEDNNYTLKDYAGGFTGYVILNFSSFMVIGEYVAAMDDIEFTNNPKLESPSAYNIELGYSFEIIGKETTLGIAYQGTDNWIMWVWHWSMPKMRTTTKVMVAPGTKKI